MAEYYFTLASLPALSYEQESVIDKDAFLENCRAQLSITDLQILQNANLNPHPIQGKRCQTLEQWGIWEINLRNQLVKMRESALGVEWGEFEVAVEENTDSEVLDKARWSFLDSLELGHYFDIGKLVIYYIKLQIIERRQMFDRERGENNFNAVIEGCTV